MRLIYGFVMLLAALAVGYWAWSRSILGLGIFAGILLCAGIFTIFEAWAGWCALRAMGIKTRI